MDKDNGDLVVNSLHCDTKERRDNVRPECYNIYEQRAVDKLTIYLRD